MKSKIKSMTMLAIAAAMLAITLPAGATEVAYPAMTAAFDVSGGVAQTTGAIALDAGSGVFAGAIGETRYYSGTFTTTYNHASYGTNNAVLVNFLRANGTTTAGTFGIPSGGYGVMRATFGPNYYEFGSVATPTTLNYQIKLTGMEYGRFQLQIFTGAGATASTEGVAAYSVISNVPFTGAGNALSFVSFTTSGTAAGTASSSNFKSSDTWIPGAVVAGVVEDPYFTPVGGTYSTEQSVSIATNTSGATIHYTLDGSPPTTSSATYSGPLAVSSSQTISALAVKSGDTDSAVIEETYILKPATPVPDVAGGTYNVKDQTVTLSSATPGATLYYTLDGNTPDNTSTLYTGPITVSEDVTISAVAYFGAFDSSSIWVGTYTFVAGTPVMTPPAGIYGSAPTVSLSTVTPGAAIYYTTDGNTPDESSTLYAGPISVSEAQTLSAVAYATGYASSAVSVGNYDIDPTVLAAWSFPTAAGERNPAELAPYTLGNGLESSIIISRGAGFVNIPSFNFAGSQFNTSVAFAAVSTDVDTALANGAYATFTLTPSTGKKVSISEVDFSVVSQAGFAPAVGEMVFSQDGFATYTSLGPVPVTNAMNGTPANLDLSGVAALQNCVLPTEFRFCFYGTTQYGAVGLGRNPSAGTDILVRGAVTDTGAGDDYDSWALANNVTGGPNGDSDNDGVPNLVEYALADGTSGTYTGGTLSFTKRGAPYGSDVTYIIEESPDLIFWEPAAAIQDGSTISYDLEGPGKMFARLKVTQP